MDASLIIKDIQAKKFAPLYFLHGEETYYIDLITEAIQKHCLEEHERDFNQTMVIVTHNAALTNIADRTLRMQDGILQ